MNITKFNKAELLFNDSERFEEFKTLGDLYNGDESGTIYKVNGVYTYTGSYGKGGFIKSDGFNISLPSHMIEIIENIRNDSESVKEINDGKVGITIYSYTLPDKYPDKQFYSVNFVEI